MLCFEVLMWYYDNDCLMTVLALISVARIETKAETVVLAVVSTVSTKSLLRSSLLLFWPSCSHCCFNAPHCYFPVAVGVFFVATAVLTAVKCLVSS